MVIKDLHKRNVALEWYEFGLKRGDDFFTKFMMHWVAFNWLYNRIPVEKERPRIRKFCEDRKDVLAKYDAFSQKEIEIFMERPVYESQEGYRFQREVLFRRVKKRDILALIETMYNVRCNLFHGSKSIINVRDRELVRASAVILEGYLKVLLEEEEFRQK